MGNIFAVIWRYVPVLIEGGDTVLMGVEGRLLELRITEDEMKARRARWTPPQPNYERGVLAKYANSSPLPP